MLMIMYKKTLGKFYRSSFPVPRCFFPSALLSFCVMLGRVYTAALQGVKAKLVETEADVAHGLPFFNIVGLPDPAVKESKIRVKSALSNSGYSFPASQRAVINLAPADLRKEGSGFDLPIALALLNASKIIRKDQLNSSLFMGELGLDGSLKPSPGALIFALLAQEKGMERIILPTPNAREASVVPGIKVLPVSHLSQVVEFLNGELDLKPVSSCLEDLFRQAGEYEHCLSEVRGQESAKRALEIAAAGAHNLLMIGPPGAGKTMLAQRLPGILPELSPEEAIETTRVYSILGLLSNDLPLITHRPFRSPHHTVSDAGMVGGGVYPRPGEISLSHNGILFLDELPEFKKNVLEALRQPMESGSVTIARAQGSLSYPSRFMLVTALNPCRCGYLGDSHHICKCTPRQVHQYRSEISGPLMDRIDLQIEVPSVRYRELSGEACGEPSAIIRERVKKARSLQRERFSKSRIYCNAQMSNRQIQKFCRIDDASHRLLENAVDRMGISARGWSKILKVARTIADLESRDNILSRNISEALSYRILDRA